jgi:hypothetical protein
MHEAEVGLTSLGLTPQESPDFSPGRRSTGKRDGDDLHDKLEYHHDEDRELYIVITHESHPLV